MVSKPPRASSVRCLPEPRCTMVDRPTLQARLELGSPRDRYEREADAVSEDIMRMPEPIGNGAPRGHIIPRSSSNGVGQSLPEAAREFMEARFGFDFRNVRVHADERSAALSRRLHARAFTIGEHIFFGRGQFSPQSVDGRRLLAHELTHTIQQSVCASPDRERSGRRVNASIGLASDSSAPTIQRSPEWMEERRDIRRRLSELSDEDLAELLDELYRGVAASGHGRTGSGTAEDPYENYAHQLRQGMPPGGTRFALGLGAGVSSTRPVEPVAGMDGLLLPVGPEPFDVLGVRPGALESTADFAARVVPVAEAEARARLRARARPPASGLFERSGSRSWSRALPSAPTPTQSPLQQEAVQAVQERLASVVVPTSSGHLRRVRRGFAYTAAGFRPMNVACRSSSTLHNRKI